MGLYNRGKRRVCAEEEKSVSAVKERKERSTRVH